jgi:hypothetical protein
MPKNVLINLKAIVHLMPKTFVSILIAKYIFSLIEALFLEPFIICLKKN